MITKDDLLAHDYPMSLAEDWEGCCPCGEIHGENFHVWFHCWRVGCGECEFSGIHVSGELDEAGKLEIGEHIKKNNGWADSTDWQVIIK